MSTDTIDRRWGRINDAVNRAGISRSSIYKLVRENTGLFRKFGAATVVDLELLDDLMAALPDAEIGTGQ
jgi:ACT domain-containing protein